MKEVRFKRMNGRNVPLQPWPQVFHVSKCFQGALDVIEIRPLTVTGIIKGISKNFVSMNLWRVMRLLWWAGFLDTSEGEPASLKHWRWDFWRTRYERRHPLKNVKPRA